MTSGCNKRRVLASVFVESITDCSCVTAPDIFPSGGRDRNKGASFLFDGNALLHGLNIWKGILYVKEFLAQNVHYGVDDHKS
jgi:hypothetical protein